ncbi:uncharacterized protein LOC120708731 isoform X1 [Panicum virgatum]|uniref:uncharacterized protein LOC120708731 isoform X1 n=1 Tax=Panicum virgatum TaxID=38727 RepID=UPI0019D65E63|nr:uncharacterized protein LOC120708731 isoform X1 [Panicum virgatum]
MQRAGPKVRSAVCRDRSIEDSRAPLQQHRFRVLQPPPTASSTSTCFCINHVCPAYGCICNHHYRRCQVASSLLFSSRSPRRLICIPPSKTDTFQRLVGSSRTLSFCPRISMVLNTGNGHIFGAQSIHTIQKAQTLAHRWNGLPELVKSQGGPSLTAPCRNLHDNSLQKCDMT